jgi:hypothetical protein
VIGHELEQQSDIARVQSVSQAVEIVQRAKDRIDIGEVGDVIAEVGHGRWINRPKPDRIDAK